MSGNEDLYDDAYGDHEEEEEEVPEEDLSELEAEFTAACEKHMVEIDKQIEIASKALQKAEKLAEKYGIPFHSHITPISQSYAPSSFYEKFNGLDSEFVYDLTSACVDDGCQGWEHSSIC